MTALAKILSYLFHPLFITMYMGFIYLITFTNLEYSLKVTGVFFGSIILFTVIYMSLLKRIGVISSFSMPHREERKIPLLFIIVIYGYLAYEMILQQNQSLNFSKIFMISSGSMAVAYIFNYFTKISLHSIGISAACAYFYFLIPNFGHDFYFIASVIILGILGTARLHLKAHSGAQIYLGYAVGWTVGMVVMVYF